MPCLPGVTEWRICCWQIQDMFDNAIERLLERTKDITKALKKTEIKGIAGAYLIFTHGKVGPRVNGLTARGKGSTAEKHRCRRLNLRHSSPFLAEPEGLWCNSRLLPAGKILLALGWRGRPCLGRCLRLDETQRVCCHLDCDGRRALGGSARESGRSWQAATTT